MRKHYPLNLQGAEDAGQLPWIDGVPSTGAQGSYPGHAIVTDAEAEILAAIDAAGLVRSGTDLTQLIQAASRGIWLGQFGGTAAALTATLPNSVVIPSLQGGVRVRGIAASNYPGGGGTLALTGVGASATSVMSCPIVGADGSSTLAAGAWKAGAFLTFDIDASGNARFSPGAAAILDSRNILGGNRQVLSTPGSNSWPIPTGASIVAYEAWGAGGGGGGANGSSGAGSGGGGGGYVYGVIATAGLTAIPYTVGAPGAGGVAGPTATSQTGGTGGTTAVGSYGTATGGGGGLPGISYVSGVSGANGTGSGGQVTESATGGGLGYSTGSGLAGGQGGAAPNANGFGQVGIGGAGAPAAFFGQGGGGAGGANAAGGAGGVGRIKFYW